MDKPMSEQMQKLAERYERATGKKFGQQTRADMVAVVRCKDCVNGTVCVNLQGAEYVDCVLDDCSVRKPDDFCSYGERKDGEG